MINKNTMIRRKKLLKAIIKSNLDCNGISKQKQSLEVFCKIGALRNFAKFTGKHLCQSIFFNKVAGLRLETLFLKKDSGTVFSCEFCEISENNLLQNTSERLLLSKFQ